MLGGTWEYPSSQKRITSYAYSYLMFYFLLKGGRDWMFYILIPQELERDLMSLYLVLKSEKDLNI